MLVLEEQTENGVPRNAEFGTGADAEKHAPLPGEEPTTRDTEDASRSTRIMLRGADVSVDSTSNIVSLAANASPVLVQINVLDISRPEEFATESRDQMLSDVVATKGLEPNGQGRDVRLGHGLDVREHALFQREDLTTNNSELV